MHTLPILASFWRTFRSACPPFPYSPAFGGHSGLHAHLSQTCHFWRTFRSVCPPFPAACFLIGQNVGRLSSHCSKCEQLVFSLARMLAACLFIGQNEGSLSSHWSEWYCVQVPSGNFGLWLSHHCHYQDDQSHARGKNVQIKNLVLPHSHILQYIKDQSNETFDFLFFS